MNRSVYYEAPFSATLDAAVEALLRSKPGFAVRLEAAPFQSPSASSRCKQSTEVLRVVVRAAEENAGLRMTGLGRRSGGDGTFSNFRTKNLETVPSVPEILSG